MKRQSLAGSAYPTDWPAIAEATKQAAGRRCVRCGHRHDPEDGYTLTVHHLDMDPANSAWHNLAALCQRCHLHIQGKVVMERVWMLPHSEWFKPFVAGFYAHKFGRDESRDYVMAHLDELIALGQGVNA
jgi:hypothetical protein